MSRGQDVVSLTPPSSGGPLRIVADGLLFFLILTGLLFSVCSVYGLEPDGAALLGVAMTWTGYDENLDALEQAAGVGLNVKNLAAIYLLIGAVMIFVAMGLVYNLSDKKMAEVEKQLGRSTDKNARLDDSLYGSHED